MSIKARITGNRELKKQLENLNDELKEEIYETIIAMSRVEIETVAKKNVPVDTGRLRSSITTLTKEIKTFNYTDREGNTYDGKLKSINPKGYDVYVGTNVIYALKIHQHGGGGENSARTSGGEKKPKGYGRFYLKKAYDQAIPKIIEAVKRIKGVE